MHAIIKTLILHTSHHHTLPYLYRLRYGLPRNLTQKFNMIIGLCKLPLQLCDLLPELSDHLHLRVLVFLGLIADEARLGRIGQG